MSVCPFVCLSINFVGWRFGKYNFYGQIMKLLAKSQYFLVLMRFGTQQTLLAPTPMSSRKKTLSRLCAFWIPVDILLRAGMFGRPDKCVHISIRRISKGRCFVDLVFKLICLLYVFHKFKL